MTFPSAHPVILGTVTARAGLRLLAKKTPADAVEVRADALLADGASADQIETALRKKKQPVLLTLRIPAEGGQRPWKIAERRALYLRLLPLVEAIDIELATADALRPVIDEAQRLKKTLVLSAHAIAKPATEKQFAQWTAQFEPRPNTILKIAARIQSWHDLQHLAALLVNHREWPIAVMGLGPYAAQSRSVLTALGSRLVYGYLDKPAAPGQPSAADVRKMVKAVRNLG
ncbi:MAG TPA: type I 3-dehydroquinate dehydratase [Candidatus Methylacidiphilales bacterium]|jgi:3-dehydroquinate dehydratase-1|nr:type I 3-dehydroquinate dehydratase [Candidatus Methylacidiphilales bacterium]